MIGDAFKFAFKSSVSRAGAWAPLPGALIVWGALYLMGYQIAAPQTWAQGIAAFLLSAGVAWIVIFLSKLIYWPYYELRQLRSKLRRSLEILFDPADQNYVRPIHELYGSTGECFSIGILNPTENTIHDVKVRALTSWFTREVIAAGRLGRSVDHHYPVDVLEIPSLHPHAPEILQLFVLSYHSASDDPAYLFNTVQRFTIEALGKDTPAIRKQFEYNPDARPMLRMMD